MTRKLVSRSLLYLLLYLLSAVAVGKEDAVKVKVADPYLDVHTGPGRGFPVFHVVDQGDWIEVLGRRTQWIKVRTPRGREGWVYRQQLARTLDETGEYVALEEMDLADFFRPHGEFGVATGEIAGVTALTFFAGYAFTENLQANLSYTEASGTLSSTELVSIGIEHHLFPRWRFSPYVLMGTGSFDVKPRTVTVDASAASEQQIFAGVGLRAWITRTFVFRSEYRTWVVLTDSDNNYELETWQNGFSVLF